MKETMPQEILEDDTLSVTLLSEAALARDWNRPEEDEAWEVLAANSKPGNAAQESLS